jgi:hypothetical protein
MSRSYRKPYCAVAGHGSAKEDKRRAVLGLRRTQEQWLRKLEDHNSALAPHSLECTWNNVWCWDRDGKRGFSCRRRMTGPSLASRRPGTRSYSASSRKRSVEPKRP